MVIAQKLHRHLTIEELEPRYAPAPLVLSTSPGGLNIYEFTDADGDTVRLTLRGGASRVEISSIGGNTPSSSDIARISFTAANLSTSLRAEITGGGGGGRTPAGDVTAVDAGGRPLLLNSITFPGDVHNLTAKQLRTLSLTGDITGTVTLAAMPAGRILAANVGNITISAAMMGSILASGDLNGTINVAGPILGTVSVGGNISGSGAVVAAGFIRAVTVGGGVASGARIMAGGELGVLSVGTGFDGAVDVAGARGIRLLSINGGDLGGTIVTRTGDISAIMVASGDIKGSAQINSQRGIRILAVAGSLLSGAKVTAGDSITMLTLAGPSGLQGTVTAGKNIGRMAIAGDLSGGVTAGGAIQGMNQISGNLSGTVKAGAGMPAVISIAGSLTSTGTVQTTSGNINSVQVGGATLNGRVLAGGNILTISVPNGNIGAVANINAGKMIGNLSALSAAGTLAAGSIVHAGQSIGRLALGGDLGGSVTADGVGGIGRLVVTGSIASTGTVVASSGGLMSLLISTGDLAGTVNVARLGYVNVTNNLTGTLAATGNFNGTILIGGNVKSTNTYALNLGGTVSGSATIDITGAADQGAGTGKNRIRFGVLDATVHVLGGQFGDVIVVNSLNSTGLLWATSQKLTATIFATNPANLTYYDGSSSSTNYLTLFGISNTTIP